MRLKRVKCGIHHSMIPSVLAEDPTTLMRLKQTGSHLSNISHVRSCHLDLLEKAV